MGEGPLWMPESNRLMWVDIERGLIFEYDVKEHRTYYRQLGRRVSLLVPAEDKDCLILGLQGGLARLSLSDGRLQWMADIEKEKADNRCNDGRADTAGRLWVGTMSTRFDTGAGALYLVKEDLTPRRKIGEVSISNGLVWSPDNARMYYIDTPTQRIQSFFFDPESGEIAFEKIAVEIPRELGSPDGMAIDAAGMLWVAHYGGFGVFRWNPFTGRLLEKISLPVPNVTACTFGGKDLDTLFITTARQELSPEELEQYPQSGNLFCIRTNAKGLPANKCSLVPPAGGPALQPAPALPFHTE
ncbi:MAG TPA: SMP-30/gluconolactonase/LRE family protein [Anseongella sp.]|nr:SMP-30/gluconolactonase/LRE family protein [Anseongella sp.]